MTETDLFARNRPVSAPERERVTPPEQPLLDEAWAIAIDLRHELGLSDAIAWADAYLDEVRERESSTAVARWAIVISALAELARSSVD